MRGVAFAGIALVGARPARRRHPAGGPRPAVDPEAMTRDNFATKLGDVIVYALFVVVPLLGVADRARRRRADGQTGPRRQAQTALGRTSAPRSCSPSSGSRMILVGMLGGVLVPDRRPRPAGHGVRGGRHRRLRLRRSCSPASAPSPGGSRSAYGRPPPDAPTLRHRRCSAWLGAAVGVGAVRDRRVRRPAGDAAVYDYDGPGRVPANTLVTIGHGAGRDRRRGDARPAVRAPAATGRRGEPDPWGSGQTLEWTTTSPAPLDNFAEVPTVMSPEPVLDLAAAPTETVGPMTYALPAAPAAAAASPGARRHHPRRRRRRSCSSAGCSSSVIRAAHAGARRRGFVGAERREDPRGPGERHARSVSPGCCVFAQWTVYGIRRRDRVHISLALGLIGLIGLADHQRPGVHLPAARPADRRERVRRDVLRDHRHDDSCCWSSGSCSPRCRRLPVPRRPRRRTRRSSPPMPCTGTSSPAAFSRCG